MALESMEESELSQHLRHIMLQGLWTNGEIVKNVEKSVHAFMLEIENESYIMRSIWW
jgi:hypothetical protein